MLLGRSMVGIWLRLWWVSWSAFVVANVMHFGRRLVGSVARRIGSAILCSYVTYSWSKIGWNMLKRWLEFGRAFVFLDRLCLIDIFIEMLPTPLVLQQYEVI